MAHLRQETARRGLPAPADSPESLRRVPAVDGTSLAPAADVARAVRHGTDTGTPEAGVRIDVHLDGAGGLPRVVDVRGAGTGEPASAAPAIAPGAVHVCDRGYFDFASIRRHLGRSTVAPAPFAMRMREPGGRSPESDRHAGRPLPERDRVAGVISDHVGRSAGSRHRTAPPGRLREVVIASPGAPGGVIRLTTDRLDVPAWVIGL